MVAQTGLLMQTGLLKEEWELLRLGLHDLPSLDQKLLPLKARAFGVAMRIVMPIVYWSDLNQRRVVSQLCANRLCTSLVPGWFHPTCHTYHKRGGNKT